MSYDPDPAVQRMLEAEEMEAVVAGAHAARDGIPYEDNPYSEKTTMWACWRAGWRRPAMYIGGTEG